MISTIFIEITKSDYKIVIKINCQKMATTHKSTNNMQIELVLIIIIIIAIQVAITNFII